MQRSTAEPPLLQYSRCSFNESSCAASEASDKFIVTVYNPVGWVVAAAPIRVPVVNAQYAVYGPDGKFVV
ncbi:hypothetical protein EVAR_86893_1 [Eumeta japonica]|uniref:Uncharacterized protein n=1 Tax=Eumeta variegata TaxID=151549 RepID=A0A4C1ZHL0_EUMVA|nr:hypothetical protein EVAR_86893_1 [Eumeta japonica]